MIELGKRQKLTIARIDNHGAFLVDLSDEQERQASVLLPGAQIPEGAGTGALVDVFIYKDSSDRLIATTAIPAITLGEIGVLKVAQVTKIGAFLEWGLDKDLFLPFREQTGKLKPGDECVAALYIDKSERLCATMRISRRLRNDSTYEEGDKVQGVIYDMSPELGAFVAVDYRFNGLIPKNELFGEHHVGDKVSARITKVRPDGKLNLSIRQKAYKQLDGDGEKIMALLDSYAGALPFTEKADPAIIERELGMSKNAFKRALGHLMKEGKVQITDTAIRKKL